MAKRTAVIDIGSNSARMIVCQKSSRYAFHIIHEAKSRVRISQNSYENGGVLQEAAISRALKALKDFHRIAKNLKCTKLLCVATSAVRDAPNRAEFLRRVRQETEINIKVIDGKKEAYFGALAAVNLLPKESDAITIDIGGGSSELALIGDGKIIQTLSLNLGTIRLKELFYDKKSDYKKIRDFIQNELKNLPTNFKTKKVIAIGGTARAIAKIVMPKDYPLKALHAYEYDMEKARIILKKISTSEVLKLKKYNIKKHRVDTIREGSAILLNILEFIGAQKIVTSGVGVREGVYLHDLLRSSAYKFPQNYNPSVRSLCDRFLINENYANSLTKNVLKLFDVLSKLHKIDNSYKKELFYAAKLSSIGVSIGFYRHNEHTFYMLLNGLNYGFTHPQKLLIAFVSLYQNKKLPKEEELANYLSLLPDLGVIEWLSFILALGKCLHKNQGRNEFDFSFENSTLHIISDKKSEVYLSAECIKELYKPFPIAIAIS